MEVDGVIADFRCIASGYNGNGKVFINNSTRHEKRDFVALYNSHSGDRSISRAGRYRGSGEPITLTQRVTLLDIVLSNITYRVVLFS